MAAVGWLRLEQSEVSVFRCDPMVMSKSWTDYKDTLVTASVPCSVQQSEVSHVHEYTWLDVGQQNVVCNIAYKKSGIHS